MGKAKDTKTDGQIIRDFRAEYKKKADAVAPILARWEFTRKNKKGILSGVFTNRDRGIDVAVWEMQDGSFGWIVCAQGRGEQRVTTTDELEQTLTKLWS